MFRGQGYDGASTMSGRLSGVQKIIQEKYPKALYLVIVHGCSEISLVRSTMSMIEKVGVFFSASAMKKRILKELCVSAQDQTSSDHLLDQFCEEAEQVHIKSSCQADIPLMSDTR